MHLNPLDLFVILAYIAASIGIGFWISRKAAQSMNSYFIGGNRTKFWKGLPAVAICSGRTFLFE